MRQRIGYGSWSGHDCGSEEPVCEEPVCEEPVCEQTVCEQTGCDKPSFELESSDGWKQLGSTADRASIPPVLTGGEIHSLRQKITQLEVQNQNLAGTLRTLCLTALLLILAAIIIIIVLLCVYYLTQCKHFQPS